MRKREKDPKRRLPEACWTVQRFSIQMYARANDPKRYMRRGCDVRDGRFEKTRNGCGVGGRDSRLAVLLTLLFLLSVLSTTIIEYYYRYGVVPTGMGKRGPPRRLTAGRRLIAGPPRTRWQTRRTLSHQPSAISHQTGTHPDPPSPRRTPFPLSPSHRTGPRPSLTRRGIGPGQRIGAAPA